VLQATLSLLGSSDRDPLTKSFATAAQTGLDILGKARGQARTQKLQAAFAHSAGLKDIAGIGVDILGLQPKAAKVDQKFFTNPLTKETKAFRSTNGVLTDDKGNVTHASQLGRDGFIPLGDANVALGASDLTNAVTTKEQNAVITARQNIAKLGGIGEKFAEEYLTVFGKARAYGGGILDKLGGVGDVIDGMIESVAGGGSSQTFAANQKVFHQKVEQFFNAYRKEITGAQAAIKELEILRDAMLTTDLGPEAFMASWNEFMAVAERGLQEHKDTLRLGLDTSAAPEASKVINFDQLPTGATE